MNVMVYLRNEFSLFTPRRRKIRGGQMESLLRESGAAFIGLGYDDVRGQEFWVLDMDRNTGLGDLNYRFRKYPFFDRAELDKGK